MFLAEYLLQDRGSVSGSQYLLSGHKTWSTVNQEFIRCFAFRQPKKLLASADEEDDGDDDWATTYWKTHSVQLFTLHRSPVMQALLSLLFYGGRNWGLKRRNNMLTVAEASSKPIRARLQGLPSDHWCTTCLHQVSSWQARPLDPTWRVCVIPTVTPRLCPCYLSSQSSFLPGVSTFSSLCVYRAGSLWSLHITFPYGFVFLMWLPLFWVGLTFPASHLSQWHLDLIPQVSRPLWWCTVSV